MSIKTYLIRGDCHGNFTWLENLKEKYEPEKTAIIILGDAGLNFYLTKTDDKIKKSVEAKGYYLYCVRGNHEARPKDVPNMKILWDDDIMGPVYYQEKYPHIRYFFDFYNYVIDGNNVLVIGGAYSVDKYHRLMRFGFSEEDNNPKITGWFNNEQLTKEEMTLCSTWYKNAKFDFVFTHTCPYDWEPTDLFLGSIDQSTVDNTMEKWLMELRDNLASWGVWCWGHFHDDRLERPYAEMYFNDIEELKNIKTRWQNYKDKNELEWWLKKSPNFYLT